MPVDDAMPVRLSELEIFTCGYGNLGFKEFLNRVQAAGAGFIADVRSVPGSTYWKDFCRPRLDELVQQAGLKYVYMGDTLGAKVLCRDNPDSHEAILGKKKFELGIRKLIEASESGKSICLMCGCSHPDRCHRSSMIGTALLAQGIDLRHVMPGGSVVLQSDLVKGVREGQHSLF